jgi:hypothetical protein
MTTQRRVVLKLLWTAVLVGALTLLSTVEHDFIYEAF